MNNKKTVPKSYSLEIGLPEKIELFWRKNHQYKSASNFVNCILKEAITKNDKKNEHL